MKLVTYNADGGWKAGVLVGDLVVDAQTVADRLSLGGDWRSVRSVIAHPTAELAECARTAEALSGELGLPSTGVRLGPPIPDPDKVLCIGLNYRDHQEESMGQVSAAQELPQFPMVFNKFSTSLIGQNEPIEPPAATKELDWEAELAVVIGRTARNVRLDDALDYVAGYAAFNDVSARDLQLRSSQWAIGKGFDTSGPFGPCLVTADEIADPQDLTVVGRLNGEVMQQSSTSLMIFSVAQLIEYISQAITLLPGDIIATGTPAGVGFARKPPIRLVSGDVFEVEIEGIGILSNPVIDPRSAFVSRLEELEGVV